MNARTHLVLINELKSHPYGISGDYDVMQLFKIYTTCELTSFTDIYKDHKKFLHFVHDHINLFSEVTRNEKNEIIKEDVESIIRMARYLSLKLNSLHSKYFESYRREQEDFVNTVEKMIGNSKINLLEVGSGSIPYSSILLAKDMGQISSMDQFLMSKASLKQLNINAIEKHFDNDTDISTYDFIVGQKPCSAIGEIVRKCGKTKTPYYLQLCTCKAPSHTLASWEGYLRMLDPNIKFTHDSTHAYNLDSPFLK